jgi:opacity protein-like surface antigen
MWLKTFLFVSVFVSASTAQPFSAGLKVGAPLTDALKTSTVSGFAQAAASTHRYAIGPYVELRLPFRFSLEVDALYRSYEYRLAPGAATTSVGTWEFPFLAKYKLLKGPVKPYVEGGLVFSRLTGIKDLVELNHRANYGISLGAGVEIHALVLRVSPEIRYDGFAFRNFDSLGGALHSNRNQAMFLVGIGF